MRYSSNPRLAALAAALEKLEGPVIFLLTGASGYYTYEGLCALVADADQLAKCGYALLSVGVTCGFYLLWRKALALAPLLDRDNRRPALGIVFVIAFGAVGVGSFLNSTRIFGREAVVIEMERAAEEYSDAATAASAQADHALAGLAALQVNTAKFERLEQAEHQGGGTGFRGAGAVASMDGQVAATMRAAAQDAEQKTKQAKAYAEQNQAQLAAMRKALADAKLTLPEKSVAFAAAVEAVRLNLVAMTGLEIDSTIHAAIAAAREAVPPALSKDPAVAQSQRAAIKELGDTVAHLDSLTATVSDQRPPPLLGKPFHPITVYAAVIRHLLDFAPLALAVLLVDLIPVPLLMLNILVQRSINGDAANDAAARFTVRDIEEGLELAARLEARLRARPRPPQADWPPPRIVWHRPE